MSELVFRDPPPPSPRVRLVDWAALADELKQHRGRWVYLGEHTTGTCGRLMARAYPGFDGQWEITTRRIPNSKLRDLYLRYMGESEQPDLHAHIDFGTETR